LPDRWGMVARHLLFIKTGAGTGRARPPTGSLNSLFSLWSDPVVTPWPDGSLDILYHGMGE